jgi:6-pyruvoyltetrahydropterin/6-carboxytetrahydropterin synthase
LRFTATDQFNAAHHLVGAGICEKPHGHTYKVEACARLQAGQGALLSQALRRFCVGWHNQDLNSIMEYPSAENLAQWGFDRMRAELPGLVWLRIWEGHGKWAEANQEDPFLERRC